MDRVPEISLAQFTRGDALSRTQFGAAAFASLQRFGFLILKDHDVAPALLERSYQLSEALFTLPRDVKLSYAGGLRGYTPFGTEHAKNSRFPDLKEFWQIGREIPAGAQREETFPANIWPAQISGFRDIFLPLYAQLEQTAEVMLRSITPQLSLESEYFTRRLRDGNSVLRLIHYPPVSADADPRCVRSAAHEDINFLTVLVAARGAGLELLDGEQRWLPVQPDPRHLIVNSGDMLARLTNDVIPAKTHRVVNPHGPNISRFSMPFFLHPTSATSLGCLPSCIGKGAKYGAINAGEFLQQRLRDIGMAGSPNARS